MSWQAQWHPFFSLVYLTTAGVKCLCGGCKMSPRTSSMCSHIFLVLRDHWLYVCLHLKMEFRSCARGRQWCGIFHYHWWTASIKPRLLFSHSGLVSWGLSFLQFNHSLPLMNIFNKTDAAIFAMQDMAPFSQIIFTFNNNIRKHNYYKLRNDYYHTTMWKAPNAGKLCISTKG